MDPKYTKKDFDFQYEVVPNRDGLSITLNGKAGETINVWTALPIKHTPELGDPDTPRGTEVEVSGVDGEDQKIVFKIQYLLIHFLNWV